MSNSVFWAFKRELMKKGNPIINTPVEKTYNFYVRGDWDSLYVRENPRTDINEFNYVGAIRPFSVTDAESFKYWLINGVSDGSLYYDCNQVDSIDYVTDFVRDGDLVKCNLEATVVRLELSHLRVKELRSLGKLKVRPLYKQNWRGAGIYLFIGRVQTEYLDLTNVLKLNGGDDLELMSVTNSSPSDSLLKQVIPPTSLGWYASYKDSIEEGVKLINDNSTDRGTDFTSTDSPLKACDFRPKKHYTHYVIQGNSTLTSFKVDFSDVVLDNTLPYQNNIEIAGKYVEGLPADPCPLTTFSVVGGRRITSLNFRNVAVTEIPNLNFMSDGNFSGSFADNFIDVSFQDCQFTLQSFINADSWVDMMPTVAMASFYVRQSNLVASDVGNTNFIQKLMSKGWKVAINDTYLN